MSSRRPYLIRAMHEWMTDNQQTPHIVVDAQATGVQVPKTHVKDGKIVLNVSYSATSSLLLANDSIEFLARFDGKAFDVRVPCDAVLGIYARETGQGMIFADDPDPDPPGDKSGAGERKPEKPPHLKIVK